MWDHMPLIEGQEKIATCLILGACAIGVLWALFQFLLISRVKIPIPSKVRAVLCVSYINIYHGILST